MGGFNQTAITTIGGAATVATALGTTVLGLFLALAAISAGKKKRRHAVDSEDINEEEMVMSLMYKVLDEIDTFDCIGLALCDAVALPAQQRTAVQESIISLLSPQPGIPLAWSDVKEPTAKYQYAAFIGLWASVTSNSNHCNNVFSRCTLPPSKVLDVMTNGNLFPCHSTLKNLNNIQ